MSPALKNPYRPGAALQPLFLAGRDKERRRFAAALAAAPEIPASIRLTGLRGVGKSVLLKKFEEDAAGLGWSASRMQLEPRHNTESAIAESLAAKAHQMVAKLDRGVRIRESIRDIAAAVVGKLSVSWEDVEVSLDLGKNSNQKDLATALYNVAEAAVASGGAGYVLLLDEAQVIHDDKTRGGEHPLSLLVATVNALQESGLPLALVLCGLPTLRANIQKARTYSERMFRGEDIGSLDMESARNAFTRPLEGTGIEPSDDLIDRVIHEVEGYPYFIQLWGAELWDAASGVGAVSLSQELLDAVEADIYERLDRDFYDSRMDTLTPSESDLLSRTGLCNYPPLKTSDIHVHSGKTEGNVNVLMGRLAEQGIVFRIQKGQYEYTAPKFHEYLGRRAKRLENGEASRR
ncbi:AAA family ATPase [Specibacter cremeus]|uniref:AAA family ATPase n=1 Tax=Specibacter cremeus TaxID=1629051 RepID=UPI000F76A273|nr:AAA family ATPase [Specibacter cremeus]